RYWLDYEEILVGNKHARRRPVNSIEALIFPVRLIPGHFPTAYFATARRGLSPLKHSEFEFFAHADVRFTLKSRRWLNALRCPLSAKSGHRCLGPRMSPLGSVSRMRRYCLGPYCCR